MSQIDVKVVTSLEEWLQCQQLRAATFLPTEPYEKKFDNFDFEMSIHLLAKVQDIPNACMRLRLISPAEGGIIHLEKFAILPDANESRPLLLKAITDFALEYCANNYEFKTIVNKVSV